MTQKPVIQKSRKTIEGAKKTAAKDSVKKVEKAVGSTVGNIDSLVNKHLAAFRNAEKTLAQAKALVQTYGKKYPELAGYIPAGAGEERGIHILQDASNESEGSHKFYIRIKVGEPRYEVVGAGQHDYQQVDAATWTQRFKEQLGRDRLEWLRCARRASAKHALQACSSIRS